MYTRIKEAVFKTIEDFNQQLVDSERLEQSMETVIGGKDGKLDSLQLLNFLFDIENSILNEIGIKVEILNEEILAQKVYPFENISTLIDYIQVILNSNNINKTT